MKTLHSFQNLTFAAGRACLFRLSFLTLLGGGVATPVAQATSIVGSKHDLSVSGGGSVRASTETDICIACHTPHNSSQDAPLWNRYSSGAVYTPYSSTTAKAAVGQPTGASKLCLSCHDGTVALGMVRSRAKPIALAGGIDKMPSGPANMGTDLSDDHPVSFTYDESLASKNRELKRPAALPSEVRLDKAGQLQCTSCHDPHNNQYGKFLAVNNSQSALCMACHEKDFWAASDHRTSGKQWNRQDPNPWPHTERTTVAANGCENCHTPHVAGAPQRLMVFQSEEQNCFPCHNGHVAAKNIQAEFAKSSRHDVAATTGVHDPMESVTDAPRHVECVDCHNPHAASAPAGSRAVLAGSLTGVRGISAAGSAVNAASYEYEICFRCHGNRASAQSVAVARQARQPDMRLQFARGNASYHPVVAAGRNSDVPSLLSSYTASSTILCTDCHSNDQGPGAGGAGPRGPHGSVYAPLLERNLLMTDYNAESPTTYALCYKCHSRQSILGNESFSEHRRHVQDAKVACTTCHDAHGVSGSTHLINFNTDYVSANSAGRLAFTHTGRFQGTCSLTCHGVAHDNRNYGAAVIQFQSPVPQGPATPGPVTPGPRPPGSR